MGSFPLKSGIHWFDCQGIVHIFFFHPEFGRRGILFPLAASSLSDEYFTGATKQQMVPKEFFHVMNSTQNSHNYPLAVKLNSCMISIRTLQLYNIAHYSKKRFGYLAISTVKRVQSRRLLPKAFTSILALFPHVECTICACYMHKLNSAEPCFGS